MHIKLSVPPALKKAWNDNPLAVIGVGALAVTSAAKFLDAVSAAQGRKAYAKQINHSVKQKNRK